MLAHVRDATRRVHGRLEGTLGLLDSDLDVDRYREILTRLFGFWVVWQPQVAALLHDEPFLASRRRVQFLRKDLLAFGMSEMAMDGLPRCPAVPLADAHQALGSLYVMEGASLGGRIIQRNVETCLGEVGRSSCAYFNGYGTRTGEMWRKFLIRLDHEPVANKDRIADGASATFERVAWWLGRPTI